MPDAESAGFRELSISDTSPLGYIRYKTEMAETNDKGKILEDIVTRLHRISGFKATPRVKLPARYDATVLREFDVILDISVGPYPFQIPIECKNYGAPVGIADIDSYEGRLNDVGLPVQNAIFVSAGGYESGAVKKAKEKGIVLLEIDGLTKDRLSQELYAAAAGTLFVVPSVGEFSYTSTHDAGGPGLFDEKGTFGGFVLDLIWKEWIEESSLEVGDWVSHVSVPSGWGSYVNGDFCQIEKVNYRLLKEGHLLKRKGAAVKALLNAEDDKRTILGHVETKFENPLGNFDLGRFLTEAELQAELTADDPIVLAVTRLKVPRIMYDGLLGRFPWPPDDELIKQMLLLLREDPEGMAAGTSELRLDLGTDIGQLFEKPSDIWFNGIRERLGATWDQSVWEALLN